MLRPDLRPLDLRRSHQRLQNHRWWIPQVTTRCYTQKGEEADRGTETISGESRDQVSKLELGALIFRAPQHFPIPPCSTRGSESMIGCPMEHQGARDPRLDRARSESTKVLLTGITGFVGSAVAAALVTRGYPVIAVVRGVDEEHARARVSQALAHYAIPASALSVVIGDLTSEGTYEHPLFDEVTHVVHSAGCTSFAPRRSVWTSNVEGTKLLAERTRQSDRLRRFLHVSTAYCCGDRPNRVVVEDDAPRGEHGHVNDYARSKAAAELLLRSMGFGERLLIARPSVVIGHTSLGIKPSSSLYWYCRALAALRRGPSELSDRRDIVPVDYVAEALLFLLFLERPSFETYHVSAGARGSQTLGEVVRKLNGAAAQDDDSSWRKIPASAFADLGEEIRRLVRDDNEARKLAVALSACAKFGELGIDYFDNERLLSEGFRHPPRFVDYLDVCMQSTGEASLFDQLVDDA
jgi:nucleoside-diphosphate-sugar epimerase